MAPAGSDGTAGRRPASGADHRVMRELNRSLVLDMIKDGPPTSRAAIAKATGLAKPTISAIVDDLVGEGLVHEIGTGATTPGGGRPPILLEFNARSRFHVGVHLGVRRTEVVVADATGAELARVSAPTPRGKPSAGIAKIAALVKDVLRAAGAPKRHLAAVGVCVPGLVDLRTGRCLLAPNLGWRDVPVAEMLTNHLDVPVFVHNTAQASAVAETVDGAAAGAGEVVLLYVGTGVGAGILTEGRLQHGAAGIAGEIGHCRAPGADGPCNCGKIGCLETVASGPAIARAAEAAIASGADTSMRRGRRKVRAEDVSAAAADGDRVALSVLAAAGRDLGIAASWLINLLNPEVLVVGGGVAGAGEPLLGPLRATALELALPQAAERVSIRASMLGQDAEVRGAVLVALQHAETYYRLIFQG